MDVAVQQVNLVVVQMETVLLMEITFRLADKNNGELKHYANIVNISRGIVRYSEIVVVSKIINKS